jgi:hypothetical protein
MEVVAGLQLEVAPARVVLQLLRAPRGRAGWVLAERAVDEGARQGGLAAGQLQRLQEGLERLLLAARCRPGGLGGSRRYLPAARRCVKPGPARQLGRYYLGRSARLGAGGGRRWISVSVLVTAVGSPPRR